MRPDKIFDISSARVNKLLKVLSEILFKSLERYSIDRTSPQEPFAMKRNCLNSLFVFLSKPSAILFIIDTPARCT